MAHMRGREREREGELGEEEEEADRDYKGSYWGYTGIMEKNMETTI